MLSGLRTGESALSSAPSFPAKRVPRPPGPPPHQRPSARRHSTSPPALCLPAATPDPPGCGRTTADTAKSDLKLRPEAPRIFLPRSQRQFPAFSALGSYRRPLMLSILTSFTPPHASHDEHGKQLHRCALSSSHDRSRQQSNDRLVPLPGSPGKIPPCRPTLPDSSKPKHPRKWVPRQRACLQNDARLRH